MFVYSFNILASSHILSQRYLDNKDAFQELASVSSVLKKMPLNICLKWYSNHWISSVQTCQCKSLHSQMHIQPEYECYYSNNVIGVHYRLLRFYHFKSMRSYHNIRCCALSNLKWLITTVLISLLQADHIAYMTKTSMKVHVTKALQLDIWDDNSYSIQQFEKSIQKPIQVSSIHRNNFIVCLSRTIHALSISLIAYLTLWRTSFQIEVIADLPVGENLQDHIFYPGQPHFRWDHWCRWKYDQFIHG